MPSKVPNEILIKIFQQLHPIDQMECTLVCHRWNKLLEDYVLYQTVFIFSLVNLKKLLQKMQQRSDIANRIEKLILRSETEEEAYSSSKLLSLIPNLKVLCHGMPTVLDNKTKYPWCNQIEYISVGSRGGLPDYFLSCDRFPNLKTLNFSYHNEHHPLLNNIFGLTSLIIEHGTLGLNDLECIHKNSPHLKSLQFRQLSYNGGAVFSGKEITPATSVTEFVARVNCDVDDGWVTFIHPELHAELLVYISRKYPNLSTLGYKYYGINGIDPSVTDEIIKMGWNPLLQKLGPQLKKVSIYLSREDEQHIEAFDKFGCQINYLDMYCGYHRGIAKMALSKQATYIQTLVLCITSPSLDWLKSFCVLKKLELTYKSDYRSPNLQLSDILDNSPPTLESLVLCVDCFDVNPSYTGTSNIKTLTFRGMKFDGKEDGFISRCFPQLSELKLQWCKLQNNTLKLEKTDLVNFHCLGNKVILVTTLKDIKHRSYYLHEKQYGFEEVFYPQNYRPFKSYSANYTLDPEHTLNFICNSVKNVGFKF